MPIRLRNNPYRGVNAHLQSYLQTAPSEWVSFHAEHITDLRRQLSRQLPAGYYARSEKSLQLYDVYLYTDVRPATIRPDVSIYKQQPPFEQSEQSQVLHDTQSASSAVLTFPLSAITLLDEDYTLMSIAIYSQAEQHEGRPVARIELISPSNTRHQSNFAEYRKKRIDTLMAGIRVVEIDYLHQYHGTIERVVQSGQTQVQTHRSTYLLNVFDPYPTFDQGMITVSPFSVNEPVPALVIPLVDADQTDFDINTAYQNTFNSQDYFHNLLDYSELPLAFDTYSPADQQRIRTRMEAIRTESE